MKCIIIETPKTIYFPFVPNGKINVFQVSQYLSTSDYIFIERILYKVIDYVDPDGSCGAA